MLDRDEAHAIELADRICQIIDGEEIGHSMWAMNLVFAHIMHSHPELAISIARDFIAAIQDCVPAVGEA
jgi:hypothetical protein